MTEAEELAGFARDLQQDVLARAEADENGTLRVSVFTEFMIACLVDAQEIDDGTACDHPGRGILCSGWHLSEDGDRLDLFVSLPRLDGLAGTVPKAEVDQAFRRLSAYLSKALDGLYREVDEGLDRYDMCRSIHDARADLSLVRLFVLTDGLATIDRIAPTTIGDIEVSSHLWDLRRIHRAISSGTSREPIHVDFAKMGGPIRCVVASPEGSGYRCLLAMIPGSVLVEMYKDHGPRLLERNVRSFLQLKGKVNQGIRKTILEEPEMFLAFNNGLSVTASGAAIVDRGDGTADLVSADDFQIVNGGQTTGSIFRAWRKDQASEAVSRLIVPVKITEILSDGDIDEIAPRISQSANNQNKVNMADFSSNHAFHRKMEELSRSIWAPPAQGLQRQTRWFFERARGQYHDALARNRTDADRRKWELIHPRNQLISKTDLAKHEHSWGQLPHIVSRGAQKCYLDFMDVLEQRGTFEPDSGFFERAIARAILFRQTEKIVSRHKFGGYRANIVTYTIAWLSHHTSRRLDLDAIWERQQLSEALTTFIETLCVHAHEHIVSPPGGQNVTEWAKKPACWEKFRELNMPIPEALRAELVSRERVRAADGAHGLEAEVSPAESEQVARVAAVPSQTWFDLAAWAKDTQSLQPWQRSLSVSLGRLAGAGKPPTRKQALHGDRMLEEAKTLGFRGLSDAENLGLR